MTVSLAVLYVVSFLAARIIVRTDIHRALLHAVAQRVRTGGQLLGAIMALTLLLSMFIPNFITVLTLIPLVTALVDRLPGDQTTRDASRSTLALGLIYAANVGGMASLVGSPANAVMFVVLDGAGIDAGSLTFTRWLLFGLPMAVVFLAGAGGILLAARGGTLPGDVRTTLTEPVQRPDDVRCGLEVLAAYALLGIVCTAVPERFSTATAVTSVILSLALAFGRRLPERNAPVLRPRDLFAGLPWRGLFFAVGAVALGAALHRAGAIDYALDALASALPETSPLPTLAILVITTIFLTEALSNTVTAVGMWTLALAMCKSSSLDPLMTVLAISLASTSAFMSPVSTPATALAFGGLPRVSLRSMITIGVVVNLLAAAWILLCCRTWIPWVLSP